MKQTRIIFFGTTEFASGILQTLIDEGYNVVAVVPNQINRLVENIPSR